MLLDRRLLFEIRIGQHASLLQQHARECRAGSKPSREKSHFIGAPRERTQS
jgi:hypothetical protein